MNCSTDAVAMHVAGSANDDGNAMASLYGALRTLPDARKLRGRRYEAALVLVILILAKLAGEQTVSGVAHWARLRRPWLELHLGVVRLPCANTYTYILTHLDLAALQQVVREWFIRTAPGQPVPACLEALEHWAIDGKVLRGSHRQGPEGQSGHEVLGVYAVATGSLHHCEPIPGKGYEAAAAEAFVARTDCTGKVITVDALHTRPKLCRKIRQQHGHYVMVVKRNRPQLEAEIRQLFALPPEPAYPVTTAQTVTPGHGRLTVRRIAVSTELTLALAAEWRDVAQVFLIERTVTRHGHTTYESVCGLTSLSPVQASADQLLALVQAHWHIENRCHWRRDATLGEDACTVANPTAAVALAILNAAILALFDRLGVKNARMARRDFAAHPERALDLLTQPG